MIVIERGTFAATVLATASDRLGYAIGRGFKLLEKLSPRVHDALFCATCRAIARGMRLVTRGATWPVPPPVTFFITLLEDPQPRTPLWHMAIDRVVRQLVELSVFGSGGDGNGDDGWGRVAPKPESWSN